MSENITNQQIEDLELASKSIAVDKSCDINDTAQKFLFLCDLYHTQALKRNFWVLLLKGQTQGVDMVQIIIKRFEKHRISKV